MSTRNVTKERWTIAQEHERKGIESGDDINEWLRVRRHTWANLTDSLKDDLLIDNSTKTLEIGGGPTSIFLGLREGSKYVVDPNLDRLFKLHPFIREIEEYKDVNFISSPIEDADINQQFDVIFIINALDHLSKLGPLVDQIDGLLAPSGMLIIVVDCYADEVVRDTIQLFDVDLPHPHHFVAQDIIQMFSKYKLRKQDSKAFRLIDEIPFKGEKFDIEIYRIDKFISRMKNNPSFWGRKGDILFALKFFLCFSSAFLMALLRQKERPIHPLKKARLFIFQKEH